MKITNQTRLNIINKIADEWGVLLDAIMSNKDSLKLTNLIDHTYAGEDYDLVGIIVNLKTAYLTDYGTLVKLNINNVDCKTKAKVLKENAKNNANIIVIDNILGAIISRAITNQGQLLKFNSKTNQIINLHQNIID